MRKAPEESETELQEKRRREITRRTDLPDSVVATLKDEGVDPNELVVAACSDVEEDGTFGETWVTATHTRLFTMTPNGDRAHILLNLPVTRFKEFKVEPQVGNSILEGYTTDGEFIEVLRYSNALGRQFPQVAKHLSKLAEGEGEAFVPDARVQEDICPTCGRILQHGSGVCPHCMKKSKTLHRMGSYLLKYKWYVLSVWSLLLLTRATLLLPPFITKILIDRVLTAGGRNLALLGTLVFVLAAARLAEVFMQIVQSRLTSIAAISLTYDIRRDLYSALQKQSLSFYDRRKVGNLMSRVTSDTNMLLSFLVDGLQHVVVHVLTLLGIGLMLFVINWQLALYVLLPAPLVVLITKMVWKHIRVVYFRLHARWAHLSGTLNDSLSGIRVVKAFGQEDREIERFDDRSTDLFVAGVEASQLSQTIFPLLAFLTSSGSLLVWWFGGLKVMHGVEGFTLGTLIAFLGYLGMFYGPLQALTNISSWLSRALTASERVFEVMDAKRDVSESRHPKRIDTVDGRFEFRDVTFGYDSNIPVMKDVQLTVEPGEMIGLVGRSGAGKSTLINLICRFYDVDEGAILLDGVDLREISLDDYRRNLGVVLQEPFLFSGTVYENIVYPRPNASLEEVMQAARLANAHEFIMNSPDGYDFHVGERGRRLSGGERQRVSIARAILHNPSILILDEATASVDTETEKQIQEALENLVRGRTVFAIAHRLCTLRNADRLVVLDEGEIVEMGTHQELLRKRGAYNKLVEMQTAINKIKAVA